MTDTETFTRRQVLGAAAIGVLAGGGVAPARAQTAETAQGFVFEDADGSGRRSAGSRGIAGVMVSNGRDVVLTDADGRWRMPVAPGESLFVIKPSGWMTPLDQTNLPRFAYLHAPDGTPKDLGLRFHGIAPTGGLPESIDFPLHRQEEREKFEVVLFTDPQPESLAELGFVRDDVVAQVGADAAFGITHGDLMFDDLSVYGRYNRIIGSIGLPWYNLPGNHDMNFEAPDNEFSRETFTRVFGARYSAFQYAGGTFFLLDNVDYLGADPSKPNFSGKYRGYFGARQLQFVRNVLANVPAEDLVVLSFHIPLRTAVGDAPAIAAVDCADFLKAISTHPNSISFAGHTHTNEHWYLGKADGFSPGRHHHHVLAAVSGSWWSGPFDERGIPVALQSDGCPNGFHILSVDGVRSSTQFIPAHDPNRGQIRLVLDSQLHAPQTEVIREYRPGALLTGPIAAEALGSTRLVANFFDAGPNSLLQVSFGDGRFQSMQRAVRTDPFVEDVYAANSATKKPWVQPGPSTHLWQLPLPDSLGRGTHRIAVRGTDEFGRSHTAAMVLEVSG
jgi:hypothetical protein